MAKTMAGPPAAQDTPPPDSTAPAPKPDAEAPGPAAAFWRYVGVERILGDLSLHVRDGDVLEAVEPPGNADWWVKADAPATVFPGQPSGFRIWSPEELQRGALAEDPPTMPGWSDPQSVKTDDEATEVNQ